MRRSDAPRVPRRGVLTGPEHRLVPHPPPLHAVLADRQPDGVHSVLGDSLVEHLEGPVGQGQHVAPTGPAAVEGGGVRLLAAGEHGTQLPPAHESVRRHGQPHHEAASALVEGVVVHAVLAAVLDHARPAHEQAVEVRWRPGLQDGTMRIRSFYPIVDKCKMVKGRGCGKGWTDGRRDYRLQFSPSRETATPISILEPMTFFSEPSEDGNTEESPLPPKIYIKNTFP